jgi:hypothetical protein
MPHKINLSPLIHRPNATQNKSVPINRPSIPLPGKIFVSQALSSDVDLLFAPCYFFVFCVYTAFVMIKLAKIYRMFPVQCKMLSATLIVANALMFVSTAQAHPLEYHLEPLDSAAVERVVSSLELLTAELDTTALLDSARLPGDALGVTALLWSLEEAVTAMDTSSPPQTPTLLRSLAEAGYISSPYVVAEWEFEAERVLEAYEVLSGNFSLEVVSEAMARLEENPDQLTETQVADAEMALIRQASMLQTTAADIAQVAPFRQRLDSLTSRLSQ